MTQVVLLAGGLGTRLREETEYKPKPMVEIGGKPILWHIMKTYASFGHKRFIICAGYKANVIKDYFLNYQSHISDFTIKLGSINSLSFHDHVDGDDWEVTVADTGIETQTAGRILKVYKYLDEPNFLCTYGDGVADINLSKLMDSHRNANRIATMTVVKAPTRFGVVELDNKNQVKNFQEKPVTESWINAGYFVFERRVIDFLDEINPLEAAPLRKLSSTSELNAFRHAGFWQPMDTYRESELLNELWKGGNAPWKVW